MLGKCGSSGLVSRPPLLQFDHVQKKIFSHEDAKNSSSKTTFSGAFSNSPPPHRAWRAILFSAQNWSLGQTTSLNDACVRSISSTGVWVGGVCTREDFWGGIGRVGFWGGGGINRGDLEWDGMGRVASF